MNCSLPLCSGCYPPYSAVVFTVTGINQSLAEAKMRWVKVGCLANSGLWFDACRIITIYEN